MYYSINFAMTVDVIRVENKITGQT